MPRFERARELVNSVRTGTAVSKTGDQIPQITVGIEADGRVAIGPRRARRLDTTITVTGPNVQAGDRSVDISSSSPEGLEQARKVARQLFPQGVDIN